MGVVVSFCGNDHSFILRCLFEISNKKLSKDLGVLNEKSYFCGHN